MSERDPIKDNPFYLLELGPDCAPMEVERAGSKLAGLLELGVKRGKSYATPLGTFERTAEGIREAKAALNNPEERLFYELWASVAPTDDRIARAPGPRVGWWSDGAGQNARKADP